jgi:hypothetical protein
VVIHQGDDYFEYDNKAMVERLIIKTIQHVSSLQLFMEDTPPITEPLLSELGYLANSDAVTQTWH